MRRRYAPPTPKLPRGGYPALELDGVRTVRKGSAELRGAGVADMKDGGFFAQFVDFAAIRPAVETLLSDANPHVENRAKQRAHAKTLTQMNDWFGSPGDAAALGRLMDEGWRAGLDRITALRDKLVAQVPAPRDARRRPTFREDGDELDYDRLRAGQLETMWRVARRQVTRAPRAVTIACEIGGHCGLNPDQMFYSGACALVLAELLEAAGYRVELLATQATFGHTAPSATQVTVTTLKLASEVLRSDVVAFAAAHAAFFRYYMLLLYGGQMPGICNGGWGYPITVTPYLRALHRLAEMPRPDVIFGAFRSEAGCLDAIRNALTHITESAPGATGTLVANAI